MSDMRKLLESMTKFSFDPKGGKPGDQVRGTDKAKPRKDGKHPFAGRLVGGGAESVERDDDSLVESLMNEYKYFVPKVADGEDDEVGASPVANINPASTNQQGGVTEADPAMPGQPATSPTPAQPTGATPPTPPGQAPKPGQPPVPAGQTPKPGQPQQPQQPGQAIAPPPQQVAAMNQLKNATGNAKIIPVKAAQAAAAAQVDPTKLTADQKAQLQQVGTALSPEVNPQNINKIKSMLPQK